MTIEELIQERVNSNRDYISRINYAVAEERAKAEEEKKQAAKKMLLDGLSVDLVSKYSGLSVEEIKAL